MLNQIDQIKINQFNILLQAVDRLRILRRKLNRLIEDRKRCIASKRGDLVTLLDPVIFNTQAEMFDITSKIL